MVGSHLSRELISRGEAVRILTRSKEKVLPAGATAVPGSLEDKNSLPRAMEGADRVFLLTPLSLTESERGLAGIQAAKAAGVKKVVYLSVHKARLAPEIPHFASKYPIEDALAASGIPYTILAPNNFYQNDLGLRDPIEQYGVYPQPLGGKGLNRVDVRDIADAAANALLQPGHDGETYALIGPDAWSGEATAAVYSRHLGKTVAYGGDDLNQWAEAVRGAMPDWMVTDLVIMYDWFQKNGLLATEEEFEKQAKVLGHSPRTFDAFVAETVAAWRGAATA